MQVWMIEENHDDDTRDGWWRTDPEDGIFATEEAAQKYVDKINAGRLERWLQYPAERDYDFKQRLDRWKAENFDVPEAERTPKPEQRMRKAEDFPETERARIRAFEVTA